MKNAFLICFAILFLFSGCFINKPRQSKELPPIAKPESKVVKTGNIPIPKGGKWVKELVVSRFDDGSFECKFVTEFPSGVKGWIAIENAQPDAMVGIIPGPGIPELEIPFSVSEGGVFSRKFEKIGLPSAGIRYVTLHVGGNIAWKQPQIVHEIFVVAKDQLPFVQEIPTDIAEYVSEKMDSISKGKSSVVFDSPKLSGHKLCVTIKIQLDTLSGDSVKNLPFVIG